MQKELAFTVLVLTLTFLFGKRCKANDNWKWLDNEYEIRMKN